MELYSPELNTIEEEYIHHLANASDNNLVQIVKQKLRLLGLSEAQIVEIESRKQPLNPDFSVELLRKT